MKQVLSINMINNIQQSFRMMSLLTVLSLSPTTLLANNPAPSTGSEPIEESLPTTTTGPVAIELTEDAKKELREQAARERAEQIAENPDLVCDDKANAFQKSCCLRVQKLKRLQNQEFDLKDEKGKTLFELQKAHDQELAELTLIEGVEKLQADYISFMTKLMNKEKSSDHPLAQMNLLERDIHQGMDTVYRMKYLHEVMDILKNEVGFDHSSELTEENKNAVYDKISKHCKDKETGICLLVNPKNIQENKTLPRREKFTKNDFKDMLAAYLDSYNIATQGKSSIEARSIHGKLSLQIQKIPKSLITAQIEDYESTMNNIDKRFDPKGAGPEAENIKELYRCAELLQYGRKDVASCANLDRNVFNTINKINDELTKSSDSIFSKISELPEGLRTHLNQLSLDGAIENLNSAAYNNPGISEASDEVKLSQRDIENRLKLGSSLTSNRPKQREKFFEKIDNSFDDDKKMIFMKKLCDSKNIEPNFGAAGFHRCLDGIKEADLDKTKAKKARLKASVETLKEKVDKLTDSDTYKSLNSFKNFFADQTLSQCKPKESTDEGITLQSCMIDVEKNVTISKLVDFAGEVVAEVNFSENGKQFTTEKIIEMFSFCNAHATDEQKEEFQNECDYVSKSYRLIHENFDKVDPEFKEWSRKNMNVYDPETDTVRAVKRRGTWGMIGLGTAGAVSSSIPMFMQYQQTKMSLPFMRDQAIAQKQFGHWNSQYFNAGFMRPGFNPFGVGTGFGGYQVGAFNFTGPGAIRAPLTPQNISIP